MRLGRTTYSGHAAALTRASAAAQRKEMAKRYAEHLDGDLANEIASGGSRWYLRPGVWEAVIQSKPGEDDWKYISGLALKADPTWANRNLPGKAKQLLKAHGFGGGEGFFGKIAGGVGDAVSDVTRPVIRTAASAVESPWQEVQGLFRTGVAGVANADRAAQAVTDVRGGSVVSRAHQSTQRDPGLAMARETFGIEGEGYVGAQSTFGIMIEKLVDGEIGVDDVLSGSEKAFGSGWLPSGDIRVEQAERATRSASIAGRSLTPGRLTASLVVRPGTLPYNVISGAVDAAGILKLDPINPVLGAAGNAVKARRYFTSTDPKLWAGGRTVTENVSRWLDSSQGGKFQKWLLDEKDPVRILQGTKWNMPVDAAVRVADATDPTAVRAVLDDVLGFGMTYKPKGYWYDGVGGAWQRRRDNIRWLQNMPRAGLVDRTNPDQWTRQIHDFLINAKVDEETVRGLTERAARSSFDVTEAGKVIFGTKVADQYDVLTVAADAVNASLRATGLPGKAARELTQHWEAFESLRAYNIDAISGLEKPLPSMIRNGKEVPAPTPQMIEQFLGKWVPFPDVQTLREVRTRTGAIGDMVSLGGRVPRALDVELATVRGLDTFLKTWKPFQLLRGAYIARVVGDEQARMASAGYSSLFSHPFSFMAIAMADDGRIGKLVDRLPGATVGRFGTDVAGTRFGELDDTADFATTLYRSTTDLLDQAGRRRMPGAHVPLRLRGGAGTEPGAVEAWADNLRMLHDNEWTRRIAQGDPIQQIQADFWTSPYRRSILGSANQADLTPLAQQVSTRRGSDEYVKTVLGGWVDDLTGQDPRLVDMVSTGKISDAAYIKRGKDRYHRDLAITKEGRRYLEDLVDEGVGPERVAGAPFISAGSTVGKAYDQGINMLFDWIAVRPSNWASRSATFRQAYWDRVEDVLPYASPDARTHILGTAADQAKLPKDVRKRLAAVKDDPARTYDLDDINLLASRHAADVTKKLLYDMSNRGQAWDSLRLIFPFGEAYKEVLTTWYRLLGENPRSLRTLQKTVEGARGAGLVYDDPTTDTQMFAIPGTAPLVQALTGMQGVNFHAPVEGLSMAGSVLPGVGPTVQWAAGTFLPDKPEFDFIRDWVFMFGGEDEGTVKMFVPGWLEKVMKWDNSPESDLEFNNAVGEVVNYLAATGDYDLTNRDDILRMQRDAVPKAQRLYMMRGMLQFIAPAAPRQNIKVNTNIGGLVTAELMERFRLLQEQDPDTAYATFLDTYGEDAMLAIIPRTQSNRMGLDSTPEYVAFRQQNPDLFGKFGNVAGLFAPPGVGSDYSEYQRQFRRQERSTIPQQERVERRNSILARMQYDALKAQLPAKTSQAQKDWLSEWRVKLKEEYPGYNPADFNPGEVTRNIDDLERAAKELDGNATAGAVREYFKLRADAVAALGGRASTLQKAKKGRASREWLREWADKLAEDTPTFRRVWDQLLSRELFDDVEETADA